MMDCMMGMDCGMGMMGVVWLFWILLIALVIWGLYRLFATRRTGPTQGDGAAPRETPQEILQRRYAAGEISTEEYEERKRKLSENGGRTR